ncbi:MAG: hypothetical protein SNJ57_07210, partial [Cyanobacteriota bacterium]
LQIICRDICRLFAGIFADYLQAVAGMCQVADFHNTYVLNAIIHTFLRFYMVHMFCHASDTQIVCMGMLWGVGVGY